MLALAFDCLLGSVACCKPGAVAYQRCSAAPSNSASVVAEQASWRNVLVQVQALAPLAFCTDVLMVCCLQFMVQDPESIFQKLVNEHHGGQQPAVLTPEVKEAVVKNVRRRMTPQPLKIRADVELTCYAYDGVLFIKVAAAAPSLKLLMAEFVGADGRLRLLQHVV